MLNSGIGKEKSSGAMRYTFLLLLPLLILVACGSKKIESSWLDKPVTIDGQSADWEESKLYVDEDLQLIYGVMNNANQMNILLKFQDEQLARRITNQGLIIWFDKDKTKGIQYLDFSAQDRIISRLMESKDGKAARPQQQQNAQRNDGQRPSGPPKMAEIKWPTGSFYLIEDDMSEDLTEKGRLGVKAAAGKEGEFFCLEFSILFNEKENGYLNFAGLEKVKAEVELSGLPEDVKEQLEERMSSGPSEGGGMSGGGRPGGPPPGGGGGRGGGPGGGPGGGERPDGGGKNMSKQFDTETLKITIQMAKK